MSSNNETLVKKFKGKYYVYENIMAESWAKKNILLIKNAKKVFNDKDSALTYALKLDKKTGEFQEGTEYSVQFDTLCKDGSEVILK